MKNLLRSGALLVIASALPACGGGSGGALPLLEVVWTAQDPQNVPVTVASGGENQLKMVSDGAGGAIIAWQDFRTGSGNTDVYAQRIDAAGAVQWTVDGVGVATGAGHENDFQILGDGAGGAIFVWEDFRSGTTLDLYGQRLSAAGVPLWTAGGKALATGSGDQRDQSLVSDGAGGAILFWVDTRGADPDVYAQRINGSGDPQWAADGVPVSTATGGQGSAGVVSDGAGGAVAVWGDSRNGVDSDLYGQRVNAAGVPQWAADGVPLTAATGNQLIHSVVSDGSGGVIAAWQDWRNGTFHDIYAGRLTGTGTAPWTADGVAISTQPGYQFTPRITSDGAGGAIIVWMDENGGPGAANIYGQRLNAAGIPQWTASVHPICIAAQRQTDPQIVSDGAGGAVIAWEDFRNGDVDIYAVRMNGSGVPLWTTDGIPIVTVPPYGQADVRLVPNGFGGAVLAWIDPRPPSGGSVNIYAQGVSSTGQP